MITQTDLLENKAHQNKKGLRDFPQQFSISNYFINQYELYILCE
jgi:hypothetical protein